MIRTGPIGRPQNETQMFKEQHLPDFRFGDFMRPSSKLLKGRDMDLGWPELLVIIGMALLFFGPSKLPGLGRSLGEAIRGFKKAMNDTETESEKTPPPRPPSPPSVEQLTSTGNSDSEKQNNTEFTNSNSSKHKT